MTSTIAARCPAPEHVQLQLQRGDAAEVDQRLRPIVGVGTEPGSATRSHDQRVHQPALQAREVQHRGGRRARSARGRSRGALHPREPARGTSSAADAQARRSVARMPMRPGRPGPRSRPGRRHRRRSRRGAANARPRQAASAAGATVAVRAQPGRDQRRHARRVARCAPPPRPGTGGGAAGRCVEFARLMPMSIAA